VRSIETERPKSIATHELVFQASKIPPLGHKMFYIVKSSARNGQHSTTRARQSTTVRMAEAGEKIAISNGVNLVDLLFIFDAKRKELVSYIGTVGQFRCQRLNRERRR
jgi:hypothetical protein